MSPRRWRTRVEDILSAIEEIDTFVSEMSFDEFGGDPKTLRAVICDFIIIGEAAASMPAEIVSEYAQVPWPVMRAMRNTLVHAYFDIDPRVLWDTIHEDLPGLVVPLRSILDDTDLPEV